MRESATQMQRIVKRIAGFVQDRAGSSAFVCRRGGCAVVLCASVAREKAWRARVEALRTKSDDDADASRARDERPVATWRIATFWRYALKGLGPCPMDPLPYGGV